MKVYLFLLLMINLFFSLLFTSCNVDNNQINIGSNLILNLNSEFKQISFERSIGDVTNEEYTDYYFYDEINDLNLTITIVKSKTCLNKLETIEYLISSATLDSTPYGIPKVEFINNNKLEIYKIEIDSDFTSYFYCHDGYKIYILSDIDIEGIETIKQLNKTELFLKTGNISPSSP